MTTVSLIRCASYEPEAVEAAVRGALEALGDLEPLLRNKHVLVKPNLLSSSHKPDFPANTHPAVLRALVALLIDTYGCRVTIGDSCGTTKAGATDRAMEKSGVLEIARDLGAETVNFDHCPFERIDRPDAALLKHFNIARPVLDADVVITLPKFKTHQLTNLTGAVKNMLGAVPGRGKKQVHLAAPKPDAMAVALVDIFERVRPNLALMDAVVGMEGNGPNGGTARDVGLLLASRDSVALDAVVAALMRFGPDEVLTTSLAHERGLGEGRLEAIDVVGERIADVAPADFAKPFSHRRGFIFRLIPDVVAHWALHHLAYYQAAVSQRKCVRCGQCVANCPAGALSTAADGRVVCDPSLCIACYCCEEVCDYDAVHVRRSPLARGITIAKHILLPSHWLKRKKRKKRKETHS